MKKKLMALVCVALLTVGMTMTVAAANPSVSADGLVTGVQKATDKNGKEVKSSVKSPSQEQSDYIKNKDNLKKELGDKYKDGMGAADVKDVEFDEGTEYPVDVTFDAPSVKDGDEVEILGYNPTTKTWETIKAKAGNGTITATIPAGITTLAFITTSATTSPTTGEPVSLMVAGMAVLVGAAGAAISKKRK